jgi:tRNA pseudouridine32 synthase / 23S rRNA pseudouridine746 synthase
MARGKRHRARGKAFAPRSLCSPAVAPDLSIQAPAPSVDAERWLHVDAHLLVVDKPAGLLAVPGRGEAGRDNLTARVQAQYGDARVVHRLDQATSGLMLFARGAAAQRALSMAFEQRQVEKTYIAVVEGRPAQDHGRISAPLMADWPHRPRQQVHADGRPSLTLWQRLPGDESEGGARLRLQPVTGRSHQLRVHLAYIGHPIRGDRLYAPTPLRANRLLLHACHLALAHPVTGQAMAWHLPPPF